MSLIMEERLSDSPLVERIWRTRSENIDQFKSIAVSQWDMVIWTQNGTTQIAIQGPETQATYAPVPQDAEFFGILFKPGSYMPHLPVKNLVNGTVLLPPAANHSFWLKSSTWQIPTYENVDTFVNRLARAGLIVSDPVVEAILRGHTLHSTPRTIQRHFLQATGLTYRIIQRIQRARYATWLLQAGTPILDTVFQTGYFDQPHLNRSLKYFIGQTPMQLLDKTQSEQMSFLYNTDLPPLLYDDAVERHNQRKAV